MLVVLACFLWHTPTADIYPFSASHLRTGRALYSNTYTYLFCIECSMMSHRLYSIECNNFHVTHAFVYVNVKVFEREVKREKILESRHKELKLKMKQQAAATAATGGPGGGGGGGEG